MGMGEMEGRKERAKQASSGDDQSSDDEVAGLADTEFCNALILQLHAVLFLFLFL
ncbi:conserved hypothetical protein [Ricinus communis]|uniref:Uncharacterized protein n=1 Tax=Ricinus communis TaxID=3988 RepID=B9T6R3_RICCO|nr:conserved hypothetical protein [Ricinus communis]